MIAAFALYQLLVTLLIGLAALACEPVFVRWGFPRRLIWAAALCASLLFPVAMSLLTVPRPAGEVSVPASPPEVSPPAVMLDRGQYAAEPTAALAQRPPLVLAQRISGPTTRLRGSVAMLVRIGWPASCLALWLFYAFGICRLLIAMRAFPSIAVLGVPARLTDNLGPAVFGVWRPIILWPYWLQTAAPRMRRSALAHELEHLRARDPWLLAAGMLLVSLVPWNPPLWWQLKRLRFAVEADCDQRVVGRSSRAPHYAEVLWHIGRRRAGASPALAMLMSAPTWLERRIRLLLAVPSRRRPWLTAAGIPVTAMLLIGLAWLRAPSFAATQLRKLPPEDTSPAAQWAIAVARSQFPGLLQRPFQGTAVIAAVFDRDGHLRLIDQHRFAPGMPPGDFDMSLENHRLNVDPTEDVLYAGNEGSQGGAGVTIGPWLASRNPGRLFIVYEVLKWTPDPTRRSDRVLAALKAYAPALFVKPLPDVPAPTTLVAVFMNNDGTVNRLRQKIVPLGESFTGDWAATTYAAMGLTKQQLGRTGTTGIRNVLISYAWPRRTGDAPDVSHLDELRQRMGQSHPPHEDNMDDAAIAQRYFPDIVQRGRAAITYRIDGREAQATPWILVGRDGRVWGTGLWHNDTLWTITGPRAAAIEPLYPGTLVAGGYDPWRVRGVLISAWWITPESPVQNKADLHWPQQRQLLVTGNLFLRVWDRPPEAPPEVALSFAEAMNFGSTVYGGGFPQHPLMMVQVSPSGRDEVILSVRFTVCGIDKGVYKAAGSCLRSAHVRARYDTPVEIPLSQDPETQKMYTRIVVRIRRLRT